MAWPAPAPAGARQGRRRRLTLITADRGDFDRELALTRTVEPSVVLLRQRPDIVRAADVAALLLANLTPAVASALTAGPLELIELIDKFNRAHPFDANIFGMTRFPSNDTDEPDPLVAALERATATAAAHGLKCHLASDRAIIDDLWANAIGHMWPVVTGSQSLRTAAGME